MRAQKALWRALTAPAQDCAQGPVFSIVMAYAHGGYAITICRLSPCQNLYVSMYIYIYVYMYIYNAHRPIYAHIYTYILFLFCGQRRKAKRCPSAVLKSNLARIESGIASPMGKSFRFRFVESALKTRSGVGAEEGGSCKRAVCAS